MIDGCSPIMESRQPSVYRGVKGALHRKQENPRMGKDRDLLSEFITVYCDGSMEKFSPIMERYKKLDGGDKASKELATGLLGTFVHAREC